MAVLHLTSSCRYLCCRHSYKSQSELLRSLVFLVSDFLSNCLLVMCLQHLWNLISTKFGKSIEMAKTLSCKFYVNGWFNRGEWEAALLLSQRERPDCLQALPTGPGNQHSHDPCGTLLRAHRREVGNRKGSGNTDINEKEVANTVAHYRAGRLRHGEHG